MIKVSNLNKYYHKGGSNELHVINDTNLSLPSAGLISILGESGSGKTTLLNVLGGLDKASGVIEYDDKSFNGYKMGAIDKFRRENVGYIFQNYNLLTDMTVYDNIKLALDIIGIVDKEEVDKRIKAALEAVGLYKFRKKAAGKISGGQMQRVAIARALAKQNKVLIADEPTGNLDSHNSIEIMNILKKISETTLVLLVTHDKQLAEFYSDQILELVDGKVVNIREPKGGISLQNKNEDKIYLKDLNKVEDGQKISSVAFSEGEVPDIQITLVEKNGTYYIKSNVKLKLLEETNIELVDDHYKDTTIEDVQENLKYDNSFYNNEKKGCSFKRIFKLFADEFKKYRNVRKKARFLRIVLVIIGVILGFAAINVVSYMYTDYSSVITDSNVYYIDQKNDNYRLSDIQGLIAEGYEANAITYSHSGNSLYRDYIEFMYKKNSYEEKDASYDYYSEPYSAVEYEGLAAGRAPKNEDEYVIGYDLASKLVDKFKLDSFDELMAYIFVNGGDKPQICGVSKARTKLIYKSTSKSRHMWDYRGDKLYYSEINVETIWGRELNSSDENSHNVYLLSSDSNLTSRTLYLDTTSAIKVVDGKFTYNSTEYTIVGVGLCGVLASGLVFANTDSIKEFYGNDSFGKTVERYSAFNDGYKLVKGSMPTGAYECLAAASSPYKIGDKITENFENYQTTLTVTGLYSASPDMYEYAGTGVLLVSDVTYDLSTMSNVFDVWIHVTDAAKMKELAQKYKINLMNLKESQKSEVKESKKRNSITTAALIAVCFVIALVYIYFTMRSKLISDIYEVGVLRNLGASRTRIMEKYIIEILITTTFTTMIGYLGITMIYGAIWDKLKKLSALFPSYSVLTSPYIYLGIIILYGLNLLVGLLPTILLLRKTPSEISSKYDI